MIYFLLFFKKLVWEAILYPGKWCKYIYSVSLQVWALLAVLERNRSGIATRVPVLPINGTVPSGDASLSAMESKNHSNPQWLRACSTQIHASHQGRMIKIKTAVCKLLLETRFQSNPSLVFNWILLYSSQKVNDVEKDSSKLQPFSDRSYCIIYNSSILVPTGDNICILRKHL